MKERLDRRLKFYLFYANSKEGISSLRFGSFAHTLLLLCAFYGTPLFSEVPISIGDSPSSLNISTNVEYRHRDQRVSLCTPEALQDLKEKEWHLNPAENVLRVRRTAKGAWLRLTLLNHSSSDLSKRLVFLSVNVPNAELCSFDPKGSFEEMELSDHSDLAIGGMLSPYPNFLIHIPTQTAKTYYIHLDAYEEITYINFPVYLMDELAFTRVSALRSFLFFASMFLVSVGLLLSAFYWYKHRNKVYLSFSGCVLVLCAGFYFLHGRTIHSLLGWENKLGYYSYYLFLTTSYFFFFTHLYHLAQLLNRNIKSFAIFAVGCLFGASFILVPLFTPWAEERFFLLLGGIGVLAFYFYSVHAFLFRTGNLVVRSYLASWGLFLTAFFLKATYHFDYNPYNWISIFSAPFLFPFHAILIPYCLHKIISDKLWESPSHTILRRSKVASIDVTSAVSKLKELLEAERVYLRPELKEEHLAKELGIGSHQLSEIVKTEFKTTFPGLINSYRVEEAKRLLLEYPAMTTNEIRLRAGYSSKSAFHLEFKKITGTNPNAYRKNLILAKFEPASKDADPSEESPKRIGAGIDEST